MFNIKPIALVGGTVVCAVGFLLFIPPFRRFAVIVIGRWLVRSGKISFSAGGFGIDQRGPRPGPDAGPAHGGPEAGGSVIDGDYEEVDPPTPQRDRIGADESC